MQLCSLLASSCGQAGQPSSVLRRAHLHAAVAAVGRGQDIYPSRDPLKQVSFVSLCSDMLMPVQSYFRVMCRVRSMPG